MSDIEPILRPEQCRFAALDKDEGYVVKCPHDDFTVVEFVGKNKQGNYNDMQTARNVVVKAAAEHQNAHVLAYVYRFLDGVYLQFGLLRCREDFPDWFLNSLAEAGLRINVLPLSEADRQKAEDAKADG